MSNKSRKISKSERQQNNRSRKLGETGDGGFMHTGDGGFMHTGDDGLMTSPSDDGLMQVTSDGGLMQVPSDACFMPVSMTYSDFDQSKIAPVRFPDNSIVFAPVLHYSSLSDRIPKEMLSDEFEFYAIYWTPEMLAADIIPLHYEPITIPHPIHDNCPPFICSTSHTLSSL